MEKSYINRRYHELALGTAVVRGHFVVLHGCRLVRVGPNPFAGDDVVEIVQLVGSEPTFFRVDSQIGAS